MVKAVSSFFGTISNKFLKRSKRGDHSKVIKTETIQYAYDVLIKFKQAKIQQYKSAVGMLIAHIEIKKGTLSSLESDIDKLTSSAEENQKISESAAYETKIHEKNNRVKTIQQELDSLHNRIELFKLQMGQLHRDLAKIQEEQNETIRDLRSKREEKEIAAILAGDS